ncbi:unnamed protein product [Rhizoctonia solani]|uniref:Uncharacterized protein n=1 Tax=Rhizoctonia solani TaxID=456999 RepID=A0A8H3GP35_9AGAM|nr:unnamed protein product [Rhizoctonia solani]
MCFTASFILASITSSAPELDLHHRHSTSNRSILGSCKGLEAISIYGHLVIISNTMGEGDRYYFFTSGGWHYFDDYRNVYSEDDTLVHDASFEFLLEENTPSFYIRGVPYWFRPAGLLSQDDSSFYYVTTWYSKYYFHTPNGLYYFDYRQNVYSDKGSLVYDSSFAGDLGGPLLPIFYIDGASYWFELNALWYQASIDTRYRIHTWQKEPNLNSLNKTYCFFASGHFYYLDDHRNLYSEDGTMMYNCSSSVLADNLLAPNFQIDGTPYWLHKQGLLSRSTDDTVCRVLAWQNPLQKALQEGLLAFSPGSSDFESPNARSTIDGLQTPYITLFAESHPRYIQGTPSIPIHNTAKIATKEAIKKVQPPRNRGTKNHLCCPVCGKECRQPIALKVSSAVTG